MKKKPLDREREGKWKEEVIKYKKGVTKLDYLSQFRDEEGKGKQKRKEKEARKIIKKGDERSKVHEERKYCAGVVQRRRVGWGDEEEGAVNIASHFSFQLLLCPFPTLPPVLFQPAKTILPKLKKKS